jgi:enoyl-CoA hydratase
MSYNTILFEIKDSVATLTFNRPEKLNALNKEMFGEVRDVLNRVAGDSMVRVLVLTGQGRAFIAGADIRVFLNLDPLSARHFAQEAHEVGFQLEGLDIPVIAAVNGFALGGGCEMAMACDIIYASEEARFGQPEINLGIIPGFGGTQRLARLVGKVAAKEMCLTGRIIEAQEAKIMGLAAQIFPAPTLMEETLKVARSLADKSRGALKTLKRVMDRGLETDLRTGCALEMDGFALCFASPDAQEGAAAFLEKRSPRFGK